MLLPPFSELAVFALLLFKLVKEQLVEPFYKLIAGKVALKLTFNGNGDNARFLADNKHHGVTLFRNAKSGAVTGPQVDIDIFICGERQNAARGKQLSVADNACAVVQRSLVEENIAKQRHRCFGVDYRAR